MSKRVYLVEEYDTFGYYVIKVFSKEEDAKKCVEYLINQRSFYVGYDYEEFQVEDNYDEEVFKNEWNSHPSE